MVKKYVQGHLQIEMKDITVISGNWIEVQLVIKVANKKYEPLYEIIPGTMQKGQTLDVKRTVFRVPVSIQKT